MEVSNHNAFINRIIPFMFLGCDTEGFLSDCQNLHTSPGLFPGLQMMLSVWGKSCFVNFFFFFKEGLFNFWEYKSSRPEVRGFFSSEVVTNIMSISFVWFGVLLAAFLFRGTPSSCQAC